MKKQRENIPAEIVAACGGAAAIGRLLGNSELNPSAMASQWVNRDFRIPVARRQQLIALLEARISAGELDAIQPKWRDYLTEIY